VILRKIAKARLLNVRLLSMAMTGFFYTFKRPRTAPLMGMMKYDPIGMIATALRKSYFTAGFEANH
jgi:large subunit ribosomal protein L33